MAFPPWVGLRDSVWNPFAAFYPIWNGLTARGLLGLCGLRQKVELLAVVYAGWSAPARDILYDNFVSRCPVRHAQSSAF